MMIAGTTMLSANRISGRPMRGIWKARRGDNIARSIRWRR